jgi:outer membrane protein
LQAQLLAAESEVQMARRVLADSTRLSADALKLQAPKAEVSGAAVPALEQVLAQVQQANAGVLLKKAQHDVARQELKKHARSGGVTLDLVASAGRDRLSGDGDFGPSSNTQSQQMLGLSLNVPFYTGGWRSAKLQEAVSAEAQAAAEAHLALQTGPARLSATQAAWKASAARLDATRLGRQVGDRTTLALLQAENDAAQAELAWLRAQTDVLNTRLQLDAMTGHLSVQSLQALNAQLIP